jgi:UV DNA damage repair endonuclease
MNDNENYKILSGNKKILISAPHAVEQTRDGKIKFAEPETAMLAKKLNKIGYPAIIKTKNDNDDANYDLDCPYKTALLEICKTNNICFVLDLHQLSNKREMDFCLGTGDENNRNLLEHKIIATKTQEVALKNNFSLEINNPYAASSERTISGFCQRNNIPAMQLEINSRLVSSYFNANQFDDVFDVIVEILNLVEEEMSYENFINK